jgi:hypothetical protein
MYSNRGWRGKQAIAIHTNRLSPGHDIAIIFSNYQIERLLVSGAHLYDSTVQEYFKPSDKVTDVFSRNPLIQQSMGYNSTALNESQYPRVKDTRVLQANLELVPEDIRQMYPNQQVRQVASLQLNDKETIQKGSFVLVNFLPSNRHKS